MATLLHHVLCEDNLLARAFRDSSSVTVTNASSLDHINTFALAD